MSDFMRQMSEAGLDLATLGTPQRLDSQFSNQYNAWADRQQFTAQGVRYEHGPGFAMNAYQPIYSVSGAVESAETRPVRFWLRWLWQMLVRGLF
jgi:hypothetical protein